jgi:hypothetical protein
MASLMKCVHLSLTRMKWTTKPYQNELINKLCCYCCYIGLKDFGFHPFCNIISSYQNIFIFNGPINKLNGLNEVQAPFHKGLVGKVITNMAVFLVAKFLVCWQSSLN